MHTSKSYEATKVQDYQFLRLNSEAFAENGLIPPRFTCDGANLSPSVHVDHIPEEAKSLAVIVEDPDAPGGNFVHWVVWNIPVTHHLKEGQAPGIQGINDFGHTSYGGPCPPSGVHRYYFKVYALDTVLELPAGASKEKLEKAMSDHILGFGILTGRYGRKG